MEKIVKQYAVLTKPGIVVGNLLTMAAGFAAASRGYWNVPLFFWTLFGLSLVIMSACVWNNYIDRELDGKMMRTRERPLVIGTISPQEAKIFGTCLIVLGVMILGIGTNILATFTALFGFIIYVFAYSFSKYRLSEATFVGSLAGAIPPVVGYAAVTGSLDLTAFFLFLILISWQMPHFFAIAIYRLEDYKNGSIPVATAERSMKATKCSMFFYVLAFTVLSFLFEPYLSVIGFVWLSLALMGFFTKDDRLWARKMFFFSLVVIMVFSLWLIGMSYMRCF